MITLDEAIQHCKEKACGNTKCSEEHKQLAEWLMELKELRKLENHRHMITEDYVSFETAKLLKEKGFDEYTAMVYNQNRSFMPNGAIEDTYQTFYSAPTLQMAMKWLRKVHNLHCAVDYDFVLGWYCQITSLKETVEYDYEEMKHYHPDKDNGFSSPEEACEAAIKYCLEHKIWN